jgi:putative aldouronate transport system permease protein
MVKDRTLGAVAFDVLNHIVLLLLGLTCLVPLLHIVAVSFSSNAASIGRLVTLWPVGFNLFNYDWVLRWPQFRASFLISVERVVIGTSLNVLVTVLAAYPLAIKENFPGKGVFRWLLIFAMLFSGGLIPWYLALRSLGLINSFWGLIWPHVVSPWNIIIALNFFRQLPVEMSEAAEMDGASHLDILFRIFLPLSLPMLATITLFTAVWNWNSWFDGLIVMVDQTKYPLQTYLQTMLLQVQSMQMGLQADYELFKWLSARSLQAAQIVLTTVPILLLYPFLQRYFIHGLTLGSVKE